MLNLKNRNPTPLLLFSSTSWRCFQHPPLSHLHYPVWQATMFSSVIAGQHLPCVFLWIFQNLLFYCSQLVFQWIWIYSWFLVSLHHFYFLLNYQSFKLSIIYVFLICIFHLLCNLCSMFCIYMISLAICCWVRPCGYI